MECKNSFESIYRECFKGFSVGRVRRKKDFSQILGYFKNEYEIQYMLDGERYFLQPGSRCYRMSKGSLVLIDKYQITRTNIMGGAWHDRILIEINERDFEGICEMMGGVNLRETFENYHGVFYVQNNKEIVALFDEIDDCMQHGEMEEKEKIIRLNLIKLLIYCNRLDVCREKTINSIMFRGMIEKQKQIYAVLDYIEAHYTENIGLDELSSRFYMSKSYMSRIFKEVTSFTISEYMNLLRIAKSKEYLISTQYDLTAIAAMLGFNSLTYFERIFKKYMSITPMQYRKRKLTN